MKIIATISPLFRTELVDEIANHPLVSALRLNTGVPSPWPALEVLKRLKEKGKPIWVDLKCRQLRVTRWCVPEHQEVELNHPVTVDLPAQAFFRGEGWIDLAGAKDNKLYLLERPRYALGAGQAVNISGNYDVNGFFTATDIEYIKAAEELGILNFMLSFFEGEEDIKMLRNLLKEPEKAHIALKIESEKGVWAIDKLYDERCSIDAFLQDENLQVVVARDDLMTNLRGDAAKVMQVLLDCVKYGDSIAASHLFKSLESGDVGAADFSDVYLLQRMGYRNFLLSDTICQRHFSQAMHFWQALLDLGKNYWQAHLNAPWEPPAED